MSAYECCLLTRLCQLLEEEMRDVGFVFLMLQSNLKNAAFIICLCRCIWCKSQQFMMPLNKAYLWEFLLLKYQSPFKEPCDELVVFIEHTKKDI